MKGFVVRGKITRGRMDFIIGKVLHERLRPVVFETLVQRSIYGDVRKS